MHIRKILLDTDIGPDCDDSAALALVNLYANRGFVDVLAVTHCTSSPYGVGTIRAINNHYGHNFSVGTMQRKGFLDTPECLRYSKALSETVSEEERHGEDAVSLMLRTLAAQEDNSVHLIGIGPLRNIADLLLADEALVNRKCASFTLMAGCFPPEGYDSFLPEVEWNIEMDVAAAHTVMEKWYGSLTMCGFECGAQVPCGGIMREKLPEDHPVRMAYLLHNDGKDRPSWDLLTVRQVCVPNAEGTCLSENGTISLSAKGATTFVPSANGKHHIVRIKGDPKALSNELDTWLLMEANICRR